MSLFFTLAAAALISVSRTRDNHVPQEAFIGIIYAGFATLVMLLLARHAGGSEELEELLAGSLLTIPRHDLDSTALLYSGVGVFHWLLRSRFSASLRIGWAPSGRLESRLVGFPFLCDVWARRDILGPYGGCHARFFVFGHSAGHRPLFTRRRGLRLAFGWAVAFAASVAGIAASVGMDLPTGPSIIASLIVFLLIALLTRQLAFFVRRAQKRLNDK